MARLPAAGKIVAVVLALVLAGLATYTIFAYVSGIEQRAFEDAELVEVLVAQEVIPAGTGAAEASDAGLIATENAPRATIPVGALESLDQVDGLVTLDRILVGEVIVADRWVTPAEAVINFDIPPGFEAVSVQVGVVPGVAGFVRPGDRVSLIASVVTTPPGDQEADEEVEQEEEAPVDLENLTQYLLQDIEVLAVGQRSPIEGQIVESDSEVLLTVALEPQDAERLVFAVQNASLYFTLLPEGAEPEQTPGRTLDDLFS